MPIRVLLADDHTVMRQGLAALLRQDPKIELVGQVSSGREALERALKLRPSVVLMDVGMPDLNGIEATRQLKSEAPEIRVLILSMHSDRKFITRALESGASGYLLKGCSREELVSAVQQVASGQIALAPEAARAVVDDYLRYSAVERGALKTDLTPREREVLQLLAEGKTAKETSSALSVSQKTVETHRRNIMQKLNLHSIAELTKFAVREGITSLED